MPFEPEDKTLAQARKEAAAAGYKSMEDATWGLRSWAKAGTKIAYEQDRKQAHDTNEQRRSLHNFVHDNEDEWVKGDTALKAMNTPTPRRAQD